MATRTVKITANAETTNSTTATSNTNYSKLARLGLGVTPLRYVYLAVTNPAPKGATVTQALLTINLPATAATFSVFRVTSKWSASTVTYNTKPTVAASATATGTTAGLSITFDVTADVQSWCNGVANYGWRISASANAIIDANLSGLGPTLQVTYGEASTPPTNLSPAGGICGTTTPTFQWDTTDPAEDGLAAVNVQWSTDPTFATVTYDSGWVASTVDELNAATTGGFTPLPSGGTTVYWRSRVKDGLGLISGWSAAASLEYIAWGALTITSPSAGTVGSHTPTIAWALGGTAAQTAWRAWVTDSSGRILADSKKQPGTTATWQVPAGVMTDDTMTYTAYVSVWDTNDRVGSPGDPTELNAQTSFTFAQTGSVAAPTALSVTQPGEIPSAELQWSDASTPDGFVIIRDGKPFTSLEATDPSITISGPTYQWTDYSVIPFQTHVYQVRAISAGVESAPTASVTVKIEVTPGIWLIEPVHGYAICVTDGTQNLSQLLMTDVISIEQPLNSSQQQIIRTAMYGLNGPIDGQLYARPGERSVTEMYEDAMAMKSLDVSTVFRLACGWLNKPVQVTDLSVSLDPTGNELTDIRSVSFKVIQCGELDFTPRF